MKTLITHALIITVDAERRVITDGAIAIEGAAITAVGKTAELQGAERYDRVIDASGRLVIPGLIDAHCHLSNEGPKGFVPDDVPAIPWLTDWVRPICDVLTPEDEFALSLNAITEMIRTGTTTFFEGGTVKFPESAATAMEQAGIRGVIGRRTVDLGGRETTAAALERMERTIEAVDGRGEGRIRSWPMLVGVGTASDDLLREAWAMGTRRGSGLSMHQSFAPSEVRASIDSYGCRPIEHFEKLGILGPGLRLTHMIDVSDAEIDLLARYGVKIVHCPTTALKCGYGATALGKFPEMIEHGICVALGCDGHNCSNHLDMGVAIYLAAGLYKDNRMDTSLVPAEKAIEMATIDAAASMDMEDSIGSLEAGKRADLVLIDMDRPEWHPLVNPVTSFVWGLGTRGVDTVMIDGRIVLDRGRLTCVDEASVHREVQRLSEDVIRRSGLPVVHRWKLV